MVRAACGVGLLALVAAAPAQAVQRCVVNGKTVFQDRPCPGQEETVGESLTRTAYYRTLEHKLDELQAQGVGLILRDAPRPPEPPVRPVEDEMFVPQPRLSRAGREAQQRAEDARLKARAERNNAQAGVSLTELIQKIQQECGTGKFLEPVIGMSDEIFRHCTQVARFGNISQIVVREEGGLALRLYVFPSGPVRRVYSIAGVLTSVKP